MNNDTPSSSAGPSALSNTRKERGVIAAQACENCRQRKQRCTEERPKCASCVRMKLECRYREPQPTKKDKTLIEILDRLKSLEGKVDELSIRGAAPSAQLHTLPTFSQEAHSTSSLPIEPSRGNSWPPTTAANPRLSPIRNNSGGPHYEYVSGAYKMLTWPFIQRFFEATQFGPTQINLATLQKDGLAIMMGLRPGSPSLSTDTFSSEVSRSLDSSVSSQQNLTFGTLDLSWETVSRQSKAYFDTFNLLYPVVDRQSFQKQILTVVTSRGFDESMKSTLVLMVLALGEIAIAGTNGEPLMVFRGRPSGLKGGSSERPPGLQLFNEARKRMGFSLTECSIENVQLFVLVSLYYGTCCLHTEFWRMTSSASLACQALLTSNPEELKSPRADLVRRLFWHCLIMETFLNLEFSVPSTGLHLLEEIVGLPDFSAGDFSEEDYISNQTSHFQEHFASQIVLRRLSVEFNATLSNAFGTGINEPLPVNEVGFEGPDSPGAPSGAQSSVTATMKHLAAQLDQWRGLLPSYLSWIDTPFDPVLGTSPSTYGNQVHSRQTLDDHSQITFSTELATASTSIYLYAEDIQTAMLRTRYFYVKFLIFRPFIYKALHYPDHVTQEDAEGVAICLQSSLLWPVAMSPTRDKKRLVPCIVFWSQNLFGILILLHLSQQVPILIRIRNDILGNQFAIDAKETIRLYLDWIRDLKEIDATASWCWAIVEALFPLET